MSSLVSVRRGTFAYRLHCVILIAACATLTRTTCQLQGEYHKTAKLYHNFITQDSLLF